MKKGLVFFVASLILISPCFAPTNSTYNSTGKNNGNSIESIDFSEMCDRMKMMNQTGIINQSMFMEDFEENPVMMAVLHMNETITIKVDYNSTECMRFNMIVENSTLKNITFGEMNISGIYIKIDTIFLEEIRLELMSFKEKSSTGKFFTILWIGRKFVGAFFNGNLVVRPFKSVFKFFDVMIELAKDM